MLPNDLSLMARQPELYIPRKIAPWRVKATSSHLLMTDSLPAYFRRLLDVGDFVATVYGPKNIGKSESTIELCRQICPEFNLDEDIVFTLADFYDVMEHGSEKKWRVKLLDDFGSELDPSAGMFDPARHASHYFQTSRTFHTGYFITTPNKKYINKDMRDRLADYYIELKTKSVSGNYVKGVVHWIQQNNLTGLLYNHSLFLDGNGKINNGGIGQKIWEWTFYPPPKDIHEAYLPLRDMKGKMNLQKGAADFKKLKDGMRPLEEILVDILANKDRYIKTTKRGKNIVKRDLLRIDFSVGGMNVIKLEDMVKTELEK